MTVLEMLNTLEFIDGRNEKIDNLVQFLEDDDFYHTCRLALDSLVNFGVRTWPNFDLSERYPGVPFHVTLESLEKIANQNHSDAQLNQLRMILLHTAEDDQEDEVVRRIVLKDLRCGVQLASVNKAIEIYNKSHENKRDRLFDYPCMLTAAFDQKKIDKLFKPNKPIICQQKCDGMRFNAVVQSGNVTFYSRNGKTIDIPDETFVQKFVELANGEDVVFDGELLIDGDADGFAADRTTGNGLLNKAVRGTMEPEEAQRVTATLWDVVDLVDFRNEQSDVPYEERLAQLTRMIDDNFDHGDLAKRIFLVLTWTVRSVQEAYEIFDLMLSQNKEGVILKSPKNRWKNTRVSDQLKIKAEMDCDLRVIECVAGTGRFEGMLGAMICESSDGKVRVGVGTGFTEQQRKELYTSDMIGKIITVTYNMRIKDKTRTDVDSLFLPRFVEVRYDKDVANSSDEIK